MENFEKQKKMETKKRLVDVWMWSVSKETLWILRVSVLEKCVELERNGF